MTGRYILLYQLLVIPVLSGWVNDWDKPFSFQCPDHQFVSYIYSVHDNWFEDRRFQIGCRNHTTDSVFCRWTDYQNTPYQPLVFQCHDGEVINGISSVHFAAEEDRRYKFRCCQIFDYDCHDVHPEDCLDPIALASICADPAAWRYCRKSCQQCSGEELIYNCHFSNIENIYDGDLRYTVPDDHVLRGIVSFHDNRTHDRIFAFDVCRLRIPTTAALRTQTTATTTTTTQPTTTATTSKPTTSTTTLKPTTTTPQPISSTTPLPTTTTLQPTTPKPTITTPKLTTSTTLQPTTTTQKPTTTQKQTTTKPTTTTTITTTTTATRRPLTAKPVGVIIIG